MKLNLVLAWVWILIGFVAGAGLGLGFHREEWLGGYTSHRRRLYRLGHISFFGLAIINLLFFFTADHLCLRGTAAQAASWAFALGALTMPVCCALMAQRPQWHLLFVLPVGSLFVGGTLTLVLILNT